MTPSSSAVVRILLVRHGRTRLNAERRFLGVTDPPLDEVGAAQALRAADALRPMAAAAVYSSPLRRALDTARALAPSPLLDPDLQELHQGDLEGMRVADAVARWPAFFEAWAADPTDVPVPGGESLGACRDRAVAALRRIGAAHTPGATVLAFSHQLVIASVAATAAGRSLRAWRHFSVDHCEHREVWIDVDGRLTAPAAP